jgi:hypothetical protein
MSLFFVLSLPHTHTSLFRISQTNTTNDASCANASQKKLYPRDSSPLLRNFCFLRLVFMWPLSISLPHHTMTWHKMLFQAPYFNWWITFYVFAFLLENRFSSQFATRYLHTFHNRHCFSLDVFAVNLGLYLSRSLSLSLSLYFSSLSSSFPPCLSVFLA